MLPASGACGKVKNQDGLRPESPKWPVRPGSLPPGSLTALVVVDCFLDHAETLRLARRAGWADIYP